MLENTQSFSVVTRNKDCILLTISNGSCSLLSVVNILFRDATFAATSYLAY